MNTSIQPTSEQLEFEDWKRRKVAEEQVRDAWLAERSTYLGASEIASVLNINPHSSAHEVWLVKRGLHEVPETTAMRRGTAMEDFIANEYFLETGVLPRASRLYRNEKYPFMACNPDREVTINGVEGLLELKDVGFWPGRQWGPDGADQVPAHYLCQVQMQLAITKKRFVQLCACIDGREIRTYTYSMDPDLFSHAHIFDKETVRDMFSYCVWWWQHHIVEGHEPEVTGAQCDHGWIQGERSTYENGKLTNTDETTDELCQQLEDIQKAASAAALAEEEVKNKIKVFMVQNGADTLESSVGTFSYKTNVKGVASFRTPFASRKS